MITTEEIATKVYAMLQASEVKNFISGVIDYERNDYTKEINVNIHVPDKVIAKGKGQAVYRTHFKRLIEIRAKVVEVLKNHYESGKGYNWNIGRFNPPIKEKDQNEHFVSLALELTVREKSIN